MAKADGNQQSGKADGASENDTTTGASIEAKDGEVTITPVRRYHGVDGFKKPGDDPYPVARGRAAELIANGLAVDSKAAQKALNKMDVSPDNKGD
jgi:hypothetical protein